MLTRLDLLLLALARGGAVLLGRGGLAAVGDVPPDVKFRIAPVEVEIAPGHSITTVAYNGGVPGPLLRLREGNAVHVEITNETDRDEYVHWHGFLIPAAVDGAEEERSLAVPAHRRLSYVLTPQLAGARYVHSHAMAGRDLTRATYSGQFAFVYVEPTDNPGRYDREVFLATH